MKKLTTTAIITTGLATTIIGHGEEASADTFNNVQTPEQSQSFHSNYNNSFNSNHSNNYNQNYNTSNMNQSDSLTSYSQTSTEQTSTEQTSTKSTSSSSANLYTPVNVLTTYSIKNKLMENLSAQHGVMQTNGQQMRQLMDTQ